MSDTTAIPKRFQNTIWDEHFTKAINGDIVLARPAQPDDTVDSTYGEGRLKVKMDIISIIRNDNTTVPVFFSNRFEAELYRNFILSRHPDHPVKDYLLIGLTHNAGMEGCRLHQEMAVCPICGTFTQHGDPQTNEFYCTKCKKPFNPNQT